MITTVYKPTNITWGHHIVSPLNSGTFSSSHLWPHGPHEMRCQRLVHRIGNSWTNPGKMRHAMVALKGILVRPGRRPGPGVNHERSDVKDMTEIVRIDPISTETASKFGSSGFRHDIPQFRVLMFFSSMNSERSIHAIDSMGHEGIGCTLWRDQHWSRNIALTPGSNFT